MELQHEQQLAVDHDQGNAIVSASAGSGKTRVMIERAIRLITQKKASIKQILAVTFTEAAATEMKDRLKKALCEKYNDTGDEYLAQQISEIYSSDVSTLHSFASKLIRVYFYVAGVSPDYAIIDAEKSKKMKSECIDKTFKEFYDSKDEEFSAFIDRFSVGRSDKDVKKAIIKAFDFRQVEAHPEQYSALCDSNYREDNFENIKREYLELFYKQTSPLKQVAEESLDFFKANDLPKNADFCAGFIDDINAVLSIESIYDLKKFQGVKRRFSGETKISEEALCVRASLKKAKDTYDEIIERFTKHITSEETDMERLKKVRSDSMFFDKVITRFGEIYAQEKSQENVLDFADLEHYALKILEDEQVKSEIKAKYKYVFVDEYQDINGVQEAILKSVSDNNLFMVGDVKQSIYGFRGCKPEIFSEKFESMQKKGEKAIQLNCNFRSCQSVIDTVNDIFNYSYIKEFSGNDYKGSSELKNGGLYPSEYQGRAKLHLLKTESASKEGKEEPRVYDILSELGKNVNEDVDKTACLIAKIINDELGKKYYDVATKTEKIVTFGDITILSRALKGKYIPSLVSGLIAHGIPVTSEVEDNVCNYKEIQVLIDALKLIDCFNQDIPLASTLISPIGGLTNEDLAEISNYFYVNNQFDNPTGKRQATFVQAFNYYVKNAKTELKEKLVKFKEYIDKIRQVADFVGAFGTLKRLIDYCDYQTLLLAERTGTIKVKRLQRFLYSCLNGGKSITVKQLLDKVETAPDSFGLSECAEENTVKVMTIHASKGLEFPVVIVCGLERDSDTRDLSDQILLDRKYGEILKYYDDENRNYSETILRGVVKENKRLNLLREELRLFYVATTRAKYSLHLTFMSKTDDRQNIFTGAEKFLDYIPKSIKAEQVDATDLSFESQKLETRQILIGKKDENSVEILKKRFKFVYPFCCDEKLPLKSSVTALSKKGEEDYSPTVFVIDNQTTDSDKGITAHKILENLDFSNADVMGQVDKMIKDGVLSSEEVGALNLDGIKKAMRLSVLNCLKGKTLYKEKGFMVNIPAKMLYDTDSKEDVLLQGIIDLLAVDNGKAQIIDYKYSTLGVQALKEKYKRQLELYAYAVENVLKLKVEGKILINILSGESVEID